MAPENAARLPWRRHLLCALGLYAVAWALVGLAKLLDHAGWHVAMYVIAVLAICYLAALAGLGFLYILWLVDREVRRGLR